MYFSKHVFMEITIMIYILSCFLNEPAGKFIKLYKILYILSYCYIIYTIFLIKILMKHTSSKYIINILLNYKNIKVNEQKYNSQ